MTSTQPDPRSQAAVSTIEQHEEDWHVARRGDDLGSSPHVLLIISSLGAGGAERVISTLANAWSSRGRRVTLLTFDDGSEPPFYPLGQAIERRALGLAGSLGQGIAAVRTLCWRTRRLRSEIESRRPDVVLSFIDRTNVQTILATRGLGCPVLVSERVNPAHYRVGRSWSLLRRWLYPHASLVVVQTAAAREFFPAAVRKRTRVIANPVALPGDAPGAADDAEDASRHRVVAMGRLVDQKGFDLLLAAFAKLDAGFPDWELVIWGEGPRRVDLERQRDELGLTGRVRFPGRTNEAFGALRTGDLFVLSSRFEGFPNALCEAMAVGVPVVATDCPSGPAEIVRHGVDGLLVPVGNTDKLAAAMQRLMADAGERARLGRRGPDVLDRFGPEKILEAWDRCISELVPVPPR